MLFGAFVETGLVRAYLQVWPADANLEKSVIIYRAICHNMSGMSDAKVEIKVWSVMVHAIRTYLELRRLYLQKLEEMCTPWNRLRIAASTAIDRLSALAPMLLSSGHSVEKPQLLSPSSSQGSALGSDDFSDAVSSRVSALGTAAETSRPQNHVRRRILSHQSS
ncbi:hypothetical protein B0H15DRAFT_849423 [Mycena belliarum]|uniref:Uncharacterized protein n=1 Tax=Mycena belliarum TaxID=1033014 RepID=A0AAD6TYB9_9AGAR|nr:hypothetical protein B0H15DRAFT_849423 [Mycena belliae]